MKSYKINGHTLGYNNVLAVYDPVYDPYNLLNLPDKTIRVKFKSGFTPDKYFGDTRTLVDSTNNIWDIYKASDSWRHFFQSKYETLEVLGANTTNVTSMHGMFDGCSSLSSVALFNTSNVTDVHNMFDHCSALSSVPLYDTSNMTNMDYMFARCATLTSIPLFDTSNATSMNGMFMYNRSLTSVPLFDTSNVTEIGSMFRDCSALKTIPMFDTSNIHSMYMTFYRCGNVESGISAFYQQVSTQTNPPTYHTSAFSYCGVNTTQGAAELALIPGDWK